MKQAENARRINTNEFLERKRVEREKKSYVISKNVSNYIKDLKKQ